MDEAQKNRDVIRRIEEAWNKNNVAALDQYFDASYHNHAAVPGMPGGLQGAKMAHAMAMKAFPDRTVELVDIVADGDRVAIRTHVRGTNRGGAAWLGAPTGNDKKVDFESWAMYRLKGGKVTESWGINDGMLAMIQLGSLKPPQM